MAKERMRKRTLTFTGSVPAGKTRCPCCNRPARVLKYPAGQQWTTLICPSCGWYQVPTEHAPYGTTFDVQIWELVEVGRRAAK